MFQSIVVATDGSEPAARALETALGLNRAFGGELHLLHACDQDQLVHRPGDTDTSDVLDAAIAQAQAAGVVPSSATAVVGDAFEETMTIAGLYNADLIVSGRRGLGNIGGIFAGSTSQRIAKHANCAHLSVK